MLGRLKCRPRPSLLPVLGLENITLQDGKPMEPHCIRGWGQDSFRPSSPSQEPGPAWLSADLWKWKRSQALICRLYQASRLSLQHQTLPKPASTGTSVNSARVLLLPPPLAAESSTWKFIWMLPHMLGPQVEPAQVSNSTFFLSAHAAWPDPTA